MTTPTTTQELVERLEAWARLAKDAADSASLLSEREEFRDKSIALRLAASRLSELQDEVVRLRAALEDVDANTPTQASVVASRAHITPAQAECQQALANIGDIARAALDQQGERG